MLVPLPSCKIGLPWLGLSLALLLSCRQPNPDWMGPEPAVSDAGDATGVPPTTADGTGDVTGSDTTEGDATGSGVTGAPDCAAIDNRNECDATPGCTWVGNPALGECQPA